MPQPKCYGWVDVSEPEPVWKQFCVDSPPEELFSDAYGDSQGYRYQDGGGTGA
jgi:hypothetical protein